MGTAGEQLKYISAMIQVKGSTCGGEVGQAQGGMCLTWQWPWGHSACHRQRLPRFSSKRESKLHVLSAAHIPPISCQYVILPAPLRFYPLLNCIKSPQLSCLPGGDFALYCSPPLPARKAFACLLTCLLSFPFLLLPLYHAKEKPNTCLLSC